MSAGFNLLQGASQIPAIDSTAMSRSTAMSQSTAMYWEYEIGSKVVLGPIFPFESNNVMRKNIPGQLHLSLALQNFAASTPLYFSPDRKSVV